MLSQFCHRANVYLGAWSLQTSHRLVRIEEESETEIIYSPPWQRQEGMEGSEKKEQSEVEQGSGGELQWPEV
jgi:hypothetical protein